MYFWMMFFSCSELEKSSVLEEEAFDIDEQTEESDNINDDSIPKRTLRCRLEEMNVVQESRGQQYSYQTSYEWVGNQMTFEGGVYTYNDYGYIVSMISSQQDWEQDIQNEYQCDIWCKLLSTTTHTTSSNTTTTYETIYEWVLNIQYTQEDHYYEYNDYGYVIEIYTQQNGVEQRIFYSYECDDWCRIVEIKTITESDESEEEVVDSYEWEGNTVYHIHGFDTYNEHGYLTDSYVETTSTITSTQYSYDCLP